MTFKSLFLFTGLSLCLVGRTLASVATPYPGEIYEKQPDGSNATLFLRGHPYHGIFQTDHMGHPVVQDREGWFVYALHHNTTVSPINGRRLLKPSDRVVGIHDPPYNTPPNLRELSRKGGDDNDDDDDDYSGDIYHDLLPDRDSDSDDTDEDSESDSYTSSDAQLFRVKDLLCNGMPRSQWCPDNPEEAVVLGRAGIRTNKISGELNLIVILVQFSDQADRPMPPKSDYERLFMDPTWGPTGCVDEYFQAMSSGKLKVNVHVEDWTISSNTEEYWSFGRQGLTAKFASVANEALDNMDQRGFDWSPYDRDGDQVIDGLFIIHSGYAAEVGGTDGFTGKPWGDHRIWSHRSFVGSNDAWIASDYAVRVGTYATTSGFVGNVNQRITRIGVVVHEMGHMFGLPDMIVSAGGGGAGIGNYDVMGNMWGRDRSQLYPGILSAWSRINLGWATPTMLTAPGVYELRAAVDDPNAIFKITFGFPDGEYLLIENRVSRSYDEKNNDQGLMIWHVDDNVDATFMTTPGYPGQPGWPTNGLHYQLALLQADGAYGLEQGLDYGGENDMFKAGMSGLAPGVGLGRAATVYPNTDSYSYGLVRSTGVRIGDFSAPGDVMTFSFSIEGAPGVSALSVPDSPSSPPTLRPTDPPTIAPTPLPSPLPTRFPTVPPTPSPTNAPTPLPSPLPTRFPTVPPTPSPTNAPTPLPSPLPTRFPKVLPTPSPTNAPTPLPSPLPTRFPTVPPSPSPTKAPTPLPSPLPTRFPTLPPTPSPTNAPTPLPSPLPTRFPTIPPTTSTPSLQTQLPTIAPTSMPSLQTSPPTIAPSSMPSLQIPPPTTTPTSMPSPSPTTTPTSTSSPQPTTTPTSAPSFSVNAPSPTSPPILPPVHSPTRRPIVFPTKFPTRPPTSRPTPFSAVAASPTLSEFLSSPPISQLATFSPVRDDLITSPPASLPFELPTLAPESTVTITPTDLPMVEGDSETLTSLVTNIAFNVTTPAPTWARYRPPTPQPVPQPTKKMPAHSDLLRSMLPSSVPSPLPSFISSSTPSTLPSSIPSSTPSFIPSSTPSKSDPTSLPTKSATTNTTSFNSLPIGISSVVSRASSLSAGSDLTLITAKNTSNFLLISNDGGGLRQVSEFAEGIFDVGVVDVNQYYMVTEDSRLFQWINNSWSYIFYDCAAVTASWDGSVAVLSKSYGLIWYKIGYDPSARWSVTTGASGVIDVALVGAGTMYWIKQNGDVYRTTKYSDKGVIVGRDGRKISANKDGTVAVVKSDGSIWRKISNDDSSDWYMIHNGPATDIAVAGSSRIYFNFDGGTVIRLQF